MRMCLLDQWMRRPSVDASQRIFLELESKIQWNCCAEVANYCASQREKRSGRYVKIFSTRLDHHPLCTNLPMKTYQQDFLRASLDNDILKFAPEGFILKSGRQSPYFFNAGLFNSAALLSKLSNAFAAAL